MKKILLISLLIICCLFKVYAQSRDSEIDSLNTLLSNAKDVKSSMKIAERVNNEARVSGNKKVLVWSYNAMVGIAFDTGNFERALKIGISARESNLKYGNNSFSTQLLTVIGGSYRSLGFYDEGRNQLYQAIPYAQKIIEADKRHYRLGQIYTELAKNFEVSNKAPDSILFYFKKSYAEYKQINPASRFIIGLSMSENNLAGHYLTNGKYDSAKKYLEIDGNCKRKFKSNQIEAYRLTNLGEYYHKTKDFKKAIFYFKQSLFLADSLHAVYLKKHVYGELTKVFKVNGEEDQEKLYLGKFVEISDSLAKAEKMAIKTPMRTLLEEAKELSENVIGQYILIVVIMFLLLIIAVYLGIIFFKKFKNEQLTSAEQVKLIEEKMKMMDHSTPISKNDEEEMRIVVQLAITNDPAFFLKFNKFDQVFTRKILEIAPNLVASELEFCALLRLNFETKEIARYTGLSVRAVEGKKYRVRKKLKISSEEDINIWMSRL